MTDKELTKKEMEETVGGRKIRRVDSDAAPAKSSVELNPDESNVEPLNEPLGGLTPGGKSTS